MAGMTAASSLDAALKTQAFAQLQEGVFYNTEFFPLFERIPFTGGANINVKHHTATNTSVTTYTEGDAVGAPGTETYTTSSWPATYFKASGQITGHARDQLRNDSSGAAFFPQIAQELTYMMQAAADKASTDLMGVTGSLTNTLLTIVDSTGTVGGISRSGNSWFAGYEVDTAGSGLALTDLDIVWSNHHDAEYAANADLVLTSWTQVRTAKGLGLNFGTGNPFGMQSSPGNVDLGLGFQGMSYSGAPVVTLRDLTSTVWLFAERSSLKIGVMREWTVDLLAKTDDSDKYLLTGAFCMVGVNPRKTAKLTGA